MWTVSKQKGNGERRQEASGRRGLIASKSSEQRKISSAKGPPLFLIGSATGTIARRELSILELLLPDKAGHLNASLVIKCRPSSGR